jgi:lipopolysaccharide biosynthesis protein
VTRAIAFYLPQFHPIPENDRWWGPGFTEWTNVARARPWFRGHYQPHIPADLGFYDLRLEETRVAQAALARRYGLAGFCYYHYWFAGRRLLHRPLDAMLASGTPDFPFCLAWANESWTSTWDPRGARVLVEQRYSEADHREHLDFLLTVFDDPRYIRVSGRPLLLIYRADLIPGVAAMLDGWRAQARRRGLPGLHLCCMPHSLSDRSDDEWLALGFDAVVEFQPSYRHLPPMPRVARAALRVRRRLNRAWQRLAGDGDAFPFRVVERLSYEALVDRAIHDLDRGARVLPCVFPNWDNTPRRRDGARLIANDSPERYRMWLTAAVHAVQRRPPDERLVFINAWNEWAEGCHLEPDMRFGHRFLEATRAALAQAAHRCDPAPSGGGDSADACADPRRLTRGCRP